MSMQILNRSGNPPSDGWYEIEAPGTYPAGVDANEKPRRQQLDEVAFTSIVNRFHQEREAAGDHFAGMLVDKDHLSHDLTETTEAMAWVKDLAIRNGRLCAKLDPTDDGEAAIRNKRYKFFSTEYDPEDLEDLGGGVVRPTRLAGLAFTNRPNNRGGVRPISNRAPGAPTTTKPIPMKSIAESLGLSADADEAAILAAIATLKSKAADAETKNKENEADAVLNRFGSRVPDGAKPGWRSQLITNRKATEELMEATFPEKAEDKSKELDRIHNRGGNSPAPVTDGDSDQAKAASAKKAAAIRNRASEIQSRERIPFNQAFNRAQSELS